MTFTRQYLKKSLRYSFIGCFVVGGCILGMAATTHATTLISQPVTDGSTCLSINSACGSFSQVHASQTGYPAGAWMYIDTQGSSASLDFELSGPDSNGGPCTHCWIFATTTTYTGLMFVPITNGGTTVLMATTSSGYAFDNFSSNFVKVGIASTSSTYLYFFVVDSAGTSTPPIDNSTRIIELQPPNATTTASTSVTLSYKVYIGPNDVGADIDYNTSEINTPASLFGWIGSFFSGTSTQPYSLAFKVTATTTGEYDYSTTTTLQNTGQYLSTLTLNRCWSILCLTINDANGNQITEAHRFVVLQNSDFGSSTAGTLDYLNNALSISSASTTASTSLAYACSALTFDWSKCTLFLFVPDTTQLDKVLETLKSGILSRAPFGYLTRIMSLIATSSTTTLPVLSYTFQADSPLASTTISYDVSSLMTQSAALSNEMKSNIAGNQKTVWQIFETPVKIFIYLVLLLAMLRDVTGLPFINHRR